MNIDFQELNAQYVSKELYTTLEIFQESLSAMSKSITNMMSESFKNFTANITSPITDILKKFKENILLPSINYKYTDYKKIKGIKKLGSKKFIKKRNKM